MRTSFWTRILDLIQPRTCAVCGSRLSQNESVLCACCHLHLPLTGFSAHPYDNPLARLFWGQIPLERAAAYFFYEAQNQTSRLIFDLKYHGKATMGEDMGQLVARRFKGTGFFEGIDALVPIPISRARRWHRGYNQSEMIATGIHEVTGLPIYNKVVKRLQFNGSQTNKHAWERRQNVEGAFQLVRPDDIRGKHLLVIDDIVTTGSTIIACAQELCKAGSVRISVLSLGFTKS